MSTPIEIVREQWGWMRADYTNGAIAPHGWDEYDTALASVLRDAERFAALAEAHEDTHYYNGWGRIQKTYGAHPIVRPLSELADRLREENK